MIDETQRTIETFLDQKEKRVLMLKGAWGTGKTYFWKQFVEKRNETCSYVSLFGVESLYELRAKILLCPSSTQKGMSSGILKAWSSRIKKWSEKGLPFAKGIKGLGPLVDPLANIALERFIRDRLICIDDLERRDKKLSMSQLLGCVSKLTEEQGCRVVLIVNEDSLIEDEVAKEELTRYRDKVIDVETHFAPDILRNAHIAFDDATLASLVAEVYRQLNINNIRVMKQCR